VASVSSTGARVLEGSGLASRSNDRGRSAGHGPGERGDEVSDGASTPRDAQSDGRPVGRPRSADADEAILVATRELLAERGWEGMTLGDVAARAGVAKTTLYRRWPGKADLVVDAMAQLFATLRPIDAGSARADAAATIRELIKLLALPETQCAVLALSAHAVRDPKLRHSLRTKIVERSREIVRTGAARSAARGETNAVVSDPDLLFDVIAGTMIHRMLIAGETVDDDYLQRFLDLLLPGSR
jgi:AcrR family transcriptional regulator